MTVRRMLAQVGLMLALLVAAQPVLAGRDIQAANSNHIIRVSAGTQGIGGGTYAAISANGRLVAFESAAPDLVTGQVNDSWDTLVRNVQNGSIARVSTQNSGAAVYNTGDYTSCPTLSADGRYVAFLSRAENLVSNDGNGMPDVFVKDQATGQVTLVSVGLNGKSANDASFTPVISRDGRYVAFQSLATNLVKNDQNNAIDVFVRDLQANTTELVSITDTGQQGTDPHDYGFPGLAISDDGRYVAFAYQNLPAGGPMNGGEPGIFIRDRQLHTTHYMAQGSLPGLSADGRYLAFVTSTALVPSDKNNAPDVYLLDQVTHQFERISAPAGIAESPNADIQDAPAISANGRYVAFATSARLVSADQNGVSDIYLRDRTRATTTLISVRQGSSTAADNESHAPAISADGSRIAFTSLADNLVTGDTNNAGDVFIYMPSSPTVLPGQYRVFMPIVGN